MVARVNGNVNMKAIMNVAIAPTMIIVQLLMDVNQLINDTSTGIASVVANTIHQLANMIVSVLVLV